MRKIILLVALTLASSFTFAQQENVKKAKSKAKATTPDFVGAKTLIDAALIDETTKNLAETWFVKGFIEYRKYEVQDDKRFIIPDGTVSDADRTPDINIESEAIYNAYISWIVADSLDVKESISDPKRKSKLLFRKDIVEYLSKTNLFILQYGSNLYNAGDYIKSKKVLEDLCLMPNLEMFKNSDKVKATDSLFMDAKNFIRIATKPILTKQFNDKDTVAYLKTLNEALERYPYDIDFLSYKLDYYMKTKKEKEALETINKALEIDKSNALLYYMRGFIYSYKPDKKQDAANDFLKVIELKPDWADAYYSYGVLIFDLADDSYNRASISIRNPKDAEIEMKKANELYKNSIIYLEKARTLNVSANLDDLLRKLQAAYYKLKMEDKVKEIRAARGLK